MLVKQDLQRDTEPSQNDWSRADLIAPETAIPVPIVRQLAGSEWARGSDAHLISTDAPDGIAYCQVAATSEEEVGRAAQMAELAFQRWRRTTSLARSRALVRVSEALDELAKVDERLAKIVEMRYFGGFTEEDIALALGVNERTVRRDWQKARLLLSLALQ